MWVRKNCNRLPTSPASIEELSLQANCMMAWRTFAEHGYLKDLAASRLNLQAHGRATRSVAAGKLVLETSYTSFVEKSAVIFNVLPTKAKESKKVTVKSIIKRELGAVHEFMYFLSPHL
jgi:hypothetical protein